MEASMKVYSAKEAHDAWRAGRLAIIDVREQAEHDATRVADVPLIPMSELVERVDDLPTDRELVIMCRSGQRSARVAEYLSQQGDRGEVANLEGGILAWAAEGLPYEGETPS